MGSSSKTGKGKRRDGKGKGDIPEHTLVSRQRLRDALSIGIKFYDDKRRKWHCQNAEITEHAVRAMSTFVNCISSDILQHPFVKDSVSDMLVALEGILQSENESVIRQTIKITEKLFKILGSSICQYGFSGIIFQLLNLLSFPRSAVAISTAVALKCILSKPGSWMREDEVWDIIKTTKATENVIRILLDCIAGSLSFECLSDVISLLKAILLRWPPSRYPVANNGELMTGLIVLCANSAPSVVVSTLQLYSTLALCGDVATMLLRTTPSIVPMVVPYLQSLQPANIQIEVLILCEHLTRSQKCCDMLISLCCEPFVQGIIHAMSGWRSSHSKKVPADQVLLVTAACRAALITRWPGVHHAIFWKLQVENILLDFLIGNDKRNYRLKTPDELRTAIYNNPTDIRHYIWDILGWLAMHCEDFHFHETEKMGHLDTLIHCACLMSADLMPLRSSSCHPPVVRSFCTSVSVPIFRAVLMMLLSPCNYIASKTRELLWETLNFDDNSYLLCLLDTLKLYYIGDVSMSMACDSNQIVANLMNMVHYSSLSQSQSLILRNNGIETIIAIIDRCFKGDIHVSRSSVDPYLYNSSPRTCCWSNIERSKHENVILLYSLQALYLLISSLDFSSGLQLRSSGQTPLGNLLDISGMQNLFHNLQNILDGNFGLEYHWYASYCLSPFSFYGFPSKLGRQMQGVLNENELVDLQLIHPNGKKYGVHIVVIMARCPTLLPSESVSMDDEALNSTPCGKGGKLKHYAKCSTIIHLSNHVDSVALSKLLEYVYTGYCQVDDCILKPLLVLSKRCKMTALYHTLKRKHPRSLSPLPRCDFTQLLTFSEDPFTDITLEAKENEDAWNCSKCHISVPHVHVHKIILCSSSTYIRGLLCSGMQESYSQVVRVPICWEALVKLVTWFYSGELPKHEFHCAWDNMEPEKQLKELFVYVELSWLAEFWCLDDVHNKCLEVLTAMTSCSDANQRVLLKILESALSLSQHKIVEALVGCLSPLYPHMRDVGDLEAVDEGVVRMLQSEYACYCQERCRSCY